VVCSVALLRPQIHTADCFFSKTMSMNNNPGIPESASADTDAVAIPREPFTNPPFHYRRQHLYCDEISLQEIAAAMGTPCYVYGARGIRERLNSYRQAFGELPHRICYAVKANSNLAILKLVADMGAGFDIVSAGELYRVLQAGGAPDKVVFSGVGKTRDEMAYALDKGIHSFNCESAPELQTLASVARARGKQARVSLRVNPDVDAGTHPYISTGLREHKFGLAMEDASALYHRYRDDPGIEWVGVSCHIGSQLLDVSPLAEAASRLLEFVGTLRQDGIAIRELDIGGGLGVSYHSNEETAAIPDYGTRVLAMFAGEGLTIVAEPGRSLVAEAGVLLTRVVYVKQSGDRVFVIVDAAMNDLIRPSLYNAHHEVIPLEWTSRESMVADVVGPVCESGDFLARGRRMESVSEGDLLAVCTAGAYGFVQSSNYNSRPRPAEVLVDGEAWRVVRRRESLQDLTLGESA
jgi:diaminopimelate decarboxylase